METLKDSKILLIVVWTPNAWCNTIDNSNKNVNVYMNEYVVKKVIKYATIIMNNTSNIAISKILYECNSSPGLPKIFLYFSREGIVGITNANTVNRQIIILIFLFKCTYKNIYYK